MSSNVPEMTDPFLDINDLSSNPELATALGNMVVAWAAAESAILYAMAEVCGIPTNMAIFGFYRIPTFESRVRFIQSMIPEWQTKLDKTAISKVIGQISGLSRTRNGWVHGVWCKDKRSGEIVVFNFRAPEDKGRRKPVKTNDVQQHTSTVLDHAQALRELMPHRP